jgi:hypothetical protein
MYEKRISLYPLTAPLSQKSPRLVRIVVKGTVATCNKFSAVSDLFDVLRALDVGVGAEMKSSNRMLAYYLT